MVARRAPGVSTMRLITRPMMASMIRSGGVLAGSSPRSAAAWMTVRAAARTRRSMPGSAGRPRPAGPFASVRTLPSVSSRQGVADGQVLEAADERGGHPLRLPRELDGFQARQELGEQGAGLHPGQGGAEAVVHPEAEREVLVGVTADVEAERVVEHLLVAVGRGVGQQQRL